MTADYRDDEWSAKGSQYHSWCTEHGINDTRFEHGAIITEYGIAPPDQLDQLLLSSRR